MGKLAGNMRVHLAKTLAVENDSVRFQGCWAARHDDHIHFQVAQ
jgi:hypothetical protein